MIGHFQLSPYFEYLMGQDDHHAHGKVERGLELIDSLHAAKQDVLLIGDTVHDAEVAAEMGINCCLVYSGHQHLVRL